MCVCEVTMCGVDFVCVCVVWLCYVCLLVVCEGVGVFGMCVYVV